MAKKQEGLPENLKITRSVLEDMERLYNVLGERAKKNLYLSQNELDIIKKKPRYLNRVSSTLYQIENHVEGTSKFTSRYIKDFERINEITSESELLQEKIAETLTGQLKDISKIASLESQINSLRHHGSSLVEDVQETIKHLAQESEDLSANLADNFKVMTMSSKSTETSLRKVYDRLDNLKELSEVLAFKKIKPEEIDAEDLKLEALRLRIDIEGVADEDLPDYLEQQIKLQSRYNQLVVDNLEVQRKLFRKQEEVRDSISDTFGQWKSILGPITGVNNKLFDSLGIVEIASKDVSTQFLEALRTGQGFSKVGGTIAGALGDLRENTRGFNLKGSLSGLLGFKKAPSATAELTEQIEASESTAAPGISGSGPVPPVPIGASSDRKITPPIPVESEGEAPTPPPIPGDTRKITPPAPEVSVEIKPSIPIGTGGVTPPIPPIGGSVSPPPPGSRMVVPPMPPGAGPVPPMPPGAGPVPPMPPGAGSITPPTPPNSKITISAVPPIPPAGGGSVPPTPPPPGGRRVTPPIPGPGSPGGIPPSGGGTGGSKIDLSGLSKAYGLLIVAALKEAFNLFKLLGEQARQLSSETGLARQEAYALAKNAAEAHVSFENQLATIEELVSVHKGMVNEFQRYMELQPEVVAQIANAGKNLGYSAEEAGKLQGILMQTGASEALAGNLQVAVGNLARANKLAPGIIAKDLTENANLLAKNFSGMPKQAALAAIEIRKMGYSLSDAAKIQDHLFNVESSLTAQMEASVGLGKMIDVSEARRRAINGDILGMMKSINEQAGTYEEFLAMGPAKRMLLARAMGMEVEQLQKGLYIQKFANKLSTKELEIAQKHASEIQNLETMSAGQLQSEVARIDAVERLQTEFSKIRTQLGLALLPLIEAFAGVLIAIAPSLTLIGKLVRALLYPIELIGKILNGDWQTAFDNFGSLFFSLDGSFTSIGSSITGILKIIGNIGVGMALMIGSALTLRKVWSGLQGLWKGIGDIRSGGWRSWGRGAPPSPMRGGPLGPSSGGGGVTPPTPPAGGGSSSRSRVRPTSTPTSDDIEVISYTSGRRAAIRASDIQSSSEELSGKQSRKKFWKESEILPQTSTKVSTFNDAVKIAGDEIVNAAHQFSKTISDALHEDLNVKVNCATCDTTQITRNTSDATRTKRGSKTGTAVTQDIKESISRTPIEVSIPEKRSIKTSTESDLIEKRIMQEKVRSYRLDYAQRKKEKRDKHEEDSRDESRIQESNSGGVKGAISGAATGALEDALADKVSIFVGSLMEKVTGSSVVGDVAAATASSVTSGITDTVKTAAGTALGGYLSTGGRLKKIKDGVGALGQKAGSFIKGAGSKVAGLASGANLGSKLGGLSKFAGKGKLGMIMAAGGLLAGGAKKVVSSGLPKIGQVGSSIASGASSLAGRVGTGISSLAGKVAPGITSTAGKIAGTVSSKAGGLLGGASKLGGLAKGANLLKGIPMLGSVISAGSAIYNLTQGNFASAGLDLLGMIPGVGTALTVGRIGAQAAGLDFESKLNEGVKNTFSGDNVATTSPMVGVGPIGAPMAPSVDGKVSPANAIGTTTAAISDTGTSSQTQYTTPSKSDTAISRIAYLLEQWMQRPPTLAVEFNDGVVKKLDSTLRKSST